MQRRRFLGTIAVGAGATAVPVWLSRAFFTPDPERCDEPIRLPEVPRQHSDPDACAPGSGAYHKPLLVLVIPREVADMHARGHAFGELLNHGSDAQLAPLACFDVVCRTMPELGISDVGEPLMLVLDPASQTPVRTLDAPLPPSLDFRDRFGSDDEPEFYRRTEARIDERIALLADLIAGAADGATLVAQACRERAGLPPGELQALDELPVSLGELQPSQLDRAPAIATLAARSGDPQVREHLTALMAAAVRTRLCTGPIGEVKWARTTGCGTIVEGEDRRGGFACGMGHVPARSARFLRFYVRTDGF
jgi:hypothetical protein